MSVRSDISVFVIWKGGEKQLNLPHGSTVEDVVRNLELNVSTRIVLRMNLPIPIDEEIIDGDELRVIETVSGG
jgi:sulfur carrier protein ThiS